MNYDISNSDDIIDSRDVIERIKELRDERDELEETTDEMQEWQNRNGRELNMLEALNEEALCYSLDWGHGVTLIRDSYFKEYAQEVADGIGATDRNVTWPLNCIDWDQAAKDLQIDYITVEFDGVTYWTHSQ